MPLDFTLAAFEHFCQGVAARPVLTLADYLRRAAPLSPPFVILRLDVDYRAAHAVQLARIMAAHNLRGSFYFRCDRGTFAFDEMRTVSALGHEIGYHFETLDTCRGDFAAAADLFVQHVSWLRHAGFSVRTVAAHGSRPAAPSYRSNLDLLRLKPDLLERAGLLGETTLSVDFERVFYVSDAGWHWQRHEHYQPGGKGIRTSLQATLNDCGRWPVGLYINFHPQHWFDRPVSTIFFRLRHRIGRRWYLARHVPTVPKT